MALCAAHAAAAQVDDDPYADQVVEYEAGSGATPGFTNSAAAVGSPERFTGEGIFPSVVSPFSPPFGPDEIVSIGAGGKLVVKFNTPVRNGPANPFGIDLIIFGNSGFIDGAFPVGVISGMFGEDAGTIDVSSDGSTWHRVRNVLPDTLFPTQGYLDGGPYDARPGQIPSDFKLPVDPALTLKDLMGMTHDQLRAVYGGSGGGVGIDLAGLPVTEISFVRVSSPPGSRASPEVDGFADARHPADFNHDGFVGPADLAQLLAAWGPVAPPLLSREEDLNHDAAVGPFDLALLLSSWTTSP
jgi:hypothetical protein